MANSKGSSSEGGKSEGDKPATNPITKAGVEPHNFGHGQAASARDGDGAGRAGLTVELSAAFRIRGGGGGASLFRGQDFGGPKIGGQDIGGNRITGQDIGGDRITGQDIGGTKIAGQDIGGTRIAGGDENDLIVEFRATATAWGSPPSSAGSPTVVKGQDIGGTRIAGGDEAASQAYSSGEQRSPASLGTNDDFTPDPGSDYSGDRGGGAK